MFAESASLDVTYRCNLKCRHCYNYSGVCPFPEMSREQLIHVAKELSTVDFSSICLCGGEPLCRLDDLADAASAIKSSNPSIELAMVSNGLLWTDETAKRLFDLGIHTIQFSLDGFSDASYDFVRQSNGQLHKVMSAIEISITEGYDVMIAVLPHKKNIDEFPDIFKYCIDSGISEMRVQPLMPLGRGEENFDELCLSSSEYRRLASMLNSYKGTSRVRIEWGDPIDHFFMYREEEGIPQIAINAYGEILVTPYLPITIWDLKKHSLRQYIDLKIDELALKHPLVQNCINRICDVADLTSTLESLPKLFLEHNVNIEDDLLKETKATL